MVDACQGPCRTRKRECKNNPFCHEYLLQVLLKYQLQYTTLNYFFKQRASSPHMNANIESGGLDTFSLFGEPPLPSRKVGFLPPRLLFSTERMPRGFSPTADCN